MVVIRINGNIPPVSAKIIAEGIHAQARAGVIVLPSVCELLNEVPADEEIQIMYQDTRVAELEAELAAAIEYIKAQKDCTACAHNYEPKRCNDDYCTRCPQTSCPCSSCHGFSNWKWRGAHGTE